MSPVLDGVRIGPLDPDKGESFGQVGGQTTARRLIRHHVAMHPPELVRALSRERQDARSEVVDREEAEEFIRTVYEDAGEPLPDDSALAGFAVRGNDDAPDLQVLAFTFTSKGGRTGKGFVPYGADELAGTRRAGDAAAQIARLKDAGLPIPEQLAQLVAAYRTIGVTDSPSAADADDALIAENDRLIDEKADLQAELDEARARIADLEADPPAPGSGDDGAGAPADADTEKAAQAKALAAAFPDGYDGVNAQDVRRIVRDAADPVLARAVLAQETREGGGNRGTVVSAANEVLDRPPAG